MMMGFLSAIGRFMDGSSLAELLTTIYGDNSVVYILSGKAVSRALREHMMVDATLMIQLNAALLPAQVDRLSEPEAEGVDTNVNTDEHTL